MGCRIAGLLAPVYCTTSSSGRAVDNICHALSLRNAAVLGGVGVLNPFRIIFFTHVLWLTLKLYFSRDLRGILYVNVCHFI